MDSIKANPQLPPSSSEFRASATTKAIAPYVTAPNSGLRVSRTLYHFIELVILGAPVETIGADLREMIRTPLASSHVEALPAAREVVTYPKGTIMAQPGKKRSLRLCRGR